MADQGSEGLLSPFLRWQRLKAARAFLNGRILDVGCGSGALASLVGPGSYVGFDVDETSLLRAKDRFPNHSFKSILPPKTEKFDTVVSLAVIEHVPDPSAFLESLKQYLKNGSEANIVITTPHPSAELIHYVGAAIGIFSKHANEEHEDLLDRNKLRAAGLSAGLILHHYSRFLFFTNQIAIFKSQKL